MHIHVDRRKAASGLATRIREDSRVAYGIRTAQCVAVLAAVHIAVADHKVACLGQHVVEHHAGRRVAAGVTGMAVICVTGRAAAGCQEGCR